MRYYKGKYLIGIYALKNEGETLLALCENVRELAKVLQTAEYNVRNILSHLKKGTQKYIVFANKLRTLELIDIYSNYE